MSSRCLTIVVVVAALSTHARAEVPAAAAWTDHGLVIDAGSFGTAWDVIFEGINPCAIVEHDGVLFLYYVGADNYIDDDANVGPSNREIGLATSADGIHWAKEASNPVITYASGSGNPEEGAPSCGVRWSGSEAVAFFGANISATPTTPSVNADVRVATSSDGAGFSGQSVVVDHAGGAWGAGDELHAVGALELAGTWYAFYIPNGVAEGGTLGAAWGASHTSLTASSAVKQGTTPVRARGPMTVLLTDSTTLTYFISHREEMDVRTASTSAPLDVSAPIETYPTGGRAVVYLDAARRTWLMYYGAWSHIGLKLAPDGPLDTSGPTAPANLSASSVTGHSALLAWNAASDPETGVLEYEVMRDGIVLGRTRHLSYADAGLEELRLYRYGVRATNLHGTAGAEATLDVTTLADTIAPRITRVDAHGDPRLLTVHFDEPVEKNSAESVANYSIPAIDVVDATLGSDGRTVTLATDCHAEGVGGELTATGVLDRAATPNASSAIVGYVHTRVPGLVSLWSLDEIDGVVAGDTSGAGLGALVEGAPIWTGDSMCLDGGNWLERPLTEGLDEIFAGDVTVALWMSPDDTPSFGSSTSWGYTAFRAESLSLTYDESQRWVARVRTDDGSFELSSPPVAPGNWHHLAVALTDSALHLLVDGVHVGGSPTAITGRPLVPYYAKASTHDVYYSHLWIGVSDPLFANESNFTRGCFDDVRVYRRALSDAEVGQVILSREDPTSCPGDSDGGPAPDGAPRSDGGPPSGDDRSPQGDAATAGDEYRVSDGAAQPGDQTLDGDELAAGADGFADGDGARSESTVVGSGCGCRETSSADTTGGLVLWLLAVVMPRGRRRRRSRCLSSGDFCRETAVASRSVRHRRGEHPGARCLP